ncbi:MAG: hypothetical protein FJ405_00885 [Verrucomicrobia bacterium]|nr:hypothetical protein [Verrucomicrobiota bacterium]
MSNASFGVDLAAGSRVWVRVASVGSQGRFAFRIRKAATTVHDSFETRIPISDYPLVLLLNREAPRPGDFGSVQPVWWEWTASGRGRLVLEANTGDESIIVEVLEGAAVNNLRLLAGHFGALKRLEVDIPAAGKYLIRASWFPFVGEPLAMHLSFLPP